MKKSAVLSLLFIGSSLFPVYCALSQISPDAQIRDSPTSIIGFNHIGLSVQNLNEMVAFYETATGFELVKREKVSGSKHAASLLGLADVSYETVTFKGPNMLLELTAFAHKQHAETSKMPPQGPGMTHTCFQSPSWAPGYDKFKNAGADLLSRGNAPVDLGGYGVTYAYAYDPEGNMMELEQLDANRLTEDSLWIQQNPMWMTQVALISPDLKRLADFYRMVLEINPNRESVLTDNPRLDDIIDIDGVALDATWFIMDGPIMMELMQYKNPQTFVPKSKRHPTDLGYTFSLEVEDIQQEFSRLKKQGVDFVSAPQILGEFWMVFANDPDGNVFSLRQPTDTASMYSIKNMN